MSLQVTGFQPFTFSEQTPCPECGFNDYNITFDNKDQIFIQFKAEPCGDAIEPFESFYSEWEVDGGNVCSSNNDGGTVILSFRPPYLFNVYVLHLNVYSYVSGTLTIQVLGGPTFTIESAGSYELVFNTSLIFTNEQVDITLSGTFEGCFNGIELFGVYTNQQFAIYNINDAGNPTTLAYRNTLLNGADSLLITGQYITMGYDFRESDLDGCYRIGVADPCLNTCAQFGIENMWFRVEGGWTQNSPPPNSFNINTDDGELTISLINTGDYVLESDTAICAGLEYRYEFEVTEFSGGPTINVTIGGVAIPVTGTGVYEGTVTALNNSIEILGNASVFGATIVFTRFIIGLVEFQYNYFSNVFQVKDMSAEEMCKTVLIEGCCGDDQFNIKFFGTSFLPAIRLERRFFRAAYNTDVEAFRGFDGTNETSYADVQKTKTLRLERLPEFIVDFLSTAVYYDNFFVNGVPYVLSEPEFPEPIGNDAYELYDLELILKPKRDKIRKVNCIGTSASCLPNFFNNLPEGFLYENGIPILMEDTQFTLIEGQ